MATTVKRIGAVVVAELRACGYLESTIGQYQKTVQALADFVGDPLAYQQPDIRDAGYESKDLGPGHRSARDGQGGGRQPGEHVRLWHITRDLITHTVRCRYSHMWE